MEQCTATNKELQKAFVECFGVKWKEYWADADEIRVGYASEYGIPTFISFETWLKLTGNLWNTLTTLPLDVEMEAFDDGTMITAALYNKDWNDIQQWEEYGNNPDNLSLETIVMQAKVTYTNYLNSIEHNEEEQT